MAQKDLNVRLLLATRKFEKSLSLVEKRLGRFSRTAESAGRNLTQSLTLPIVAVGGAALRAFAQFDKMSKGLEAIAGGAKEAEKQMTSLRILAQNPGIDLKQAVAGTIKLQAVGLAAKEAERTLLQFSKAVTIGGGGAEDLGEVTRQLSQMIGKGKILSSDFRVIQERVPAIGIAMNSAFGTTNIEAIRETGISARDFVAQLTEGIASSEQFQSVQGGLANSFDNFKQAITASLVELGNAIDTSFDVQNVLSNVADRIQRAVTAFKGLEESTKKTIIKVALFVAAAGPLIFVLGKIVSIGGSLISIFKLLIPLFSVITGPIGLIVAAIALLSAGFAILYKRNEAFRIIVQKVATVIKARLVAAFRILKTIALVVFEGFKTYIGVLKSVARVFIAIGAAVFNAAKKVPILGNAITFIQKSLSFVVETIKKSFTLLPAFFAGIGAEAESLGQNVINFFKKIGINADILALKIQKGLTFDGKIKQSLQNEINALVLQKSELSNKGKEFGEAFKEAFEQSIKGLGESIGGTGDKPTVAGVKPIVDAFVPGDTIDSIGGGGIISAPEAAIVGYERLNAIIQQAERNTAFLANGVNPVGDKFNGLTKIIAEAEAKRSSMTVGLHESAGALEAMSKASERLREQMILQIEEQEKLNRKLEVQKVLGQGIADTMGAVGEVFGAAFNDLIHGSKNAASAMKALKTSVLSSVADIINILIQQAVAAAIANTAIAGGPLGLALAAGAGLLISNIIKGALAGAPRLAEGGIVPAGYPNDTYPAFLSSGERVTPPGKLPDAQGGAYIAETRIDMRDFVIAFRREELSLSRS